MPVQSRKRVRALARPVGSAVIDVISCGGGKLSAVEAKSNGAFDGGARVLQTKKLLRITEVLMADQIVLATNTERFNATDACRAKTEGAKIMPFAVGIEELASLGQPPEPPEA